MNNPLLSIAKSRFSLERTMQELGYGDFFKKCCKSPFREERSPSWGVYEKEGEWRWKDHATGEGGDQVDFFAQAKDIADNSEACRQFIEWAGISKPSDAKSESKNGTRPQKTPKETEEKKPIYPFSEWEDCKQAATEKHLTAIAEWRGYSLEFTRWLHANDYLGVYRDSPAISVRDEEGFIRGAHFKTDKGWRYTDDSPHTPIEIAGDNQSQHTLHAFFESQWDAFAFIEGLGLHKGGLDHCSVYCSRGANNAKEFAPIFRRLKQLSEDPQIYLAQQNDPPRKDGKPTGAEVFEKDARDAAARTGVLIRRIDPPRHLKDWNDWAKEGMTADALYKLLSHAGPSSTSRLSTRTVEELLSMEFSDNDCIWGDRVIQDGAPVSFLGPGGVGKSRLVMQLALCAITGKDFLQMTTRAAGKRWLFIQTENSNRRLQKDLMAMIKALKLTASEIEMVNRCLMIHTLEDDRDRFMFLDNPEDKTEIKKLIGDLNPKFVVFDPLNTFTAGDPNSDQDMRALCTHIAEVVLKGAPTRVPIILHHSITGKEGAKKALGWDAASFGRGSKALYAFCRSQINIAPRNPDDDSELLVACGKNNDGKKFPAMAVTLGQDGTYCVEDDFDQEAFEESLSERKRPRANSGQFKRQVSEQDILTLMGVGCPWRAADLQRQANEELGASKATFYRLWTSIKDQRKVRFLQESKEWIQ